VPTFAKILKFPIVLAGGWLESRGESSVAAADVGVYIVPRVSDVDILICPIVAKDRYLGWMPLGIGQPSQSKLI